MLTNKDVQCSLKWAQTIIPRCCPYLNPMRNPADDPIVFMFSGQGSQTYQMGRELFEEDPVFRHWMQMADQLVQQWLQVSFLEEVYHANRRVATPFNEILFTHPAIFAVQYALTQVLQSHGIRPDLVLGASLGEFGAAAIAGVLPFEQTLELICLQAQILDTHGARSGGMLAVLAPTSLYHTNKLIRDNTTQAAINAEQHFVVSGSKPKLRLVERLLAEQGVSCQLLPVNYSFHSPQIDALATSYMPILERESYALPGVPLVFCSSGGRVDRVTATSFWNSIRAPIRTRDTLLGMESQGSYRYLDVGPSGTLANFAKLNYRSGSASSAHACLTPFGKQRGQLDRIVEALS